MEMFDTDINRYFSNGLSIKNLIKVNHITDERRDYGVGYTIEDIRSITRGYKWSMDMFYRVNSNWYFIFE